MKPVRPVAPPKLMLHMAKRKGAGLTHAQVGAEFGMSKSTAHRKLSNWMQQGYTKQGSAK